MGHLKLDASTGHLAKRGASGHLGKHCDCDCGLGSLPSSVTVDVTNATLYACADACSPESSYVVDVPISEDSTYSGKVNGVDAYTYCHYYKNLSPRLCWDGHERSSIRVFWAGGTELVGVVGCGWRVDIISSGPCYSRWLGPGTPSNPTGIYVPYPNGENSGTIEVS